MLSFFISPPKVQVNDCQWRPSLEYSQNALAIAKQIHQSNQWKRMKTPIWQVHKGHHEDDIDGRNCRYYFGRWQSAKNTVGSFQTCKILQGLGPFSCFVSCFPVYLWYENSPCLILGKGFIIRALPTAAVLAHPTEQGLVGTSIGITPVSLGKSEHVASWLSRSAKKFPPPWHSKKWPLWREGRSCPFAPDGTAPSSELGI